MLLLLLLLPKGMRVLVVVVGTFSKNVPAPTTYIIAILRSLLSTNLPSSKIK